MRSKLWGLTAVAAFGISLSLAPFVGTGQTARGVRGPLVTTSNKPWPATFVTKQPDAPPALSPADAVKTFTMPRGYHLELVASEPLIKDPILSEFDGNGRLQVMEMPGYAIGEAMTNDFAPIADLVVLEDTNGDGVYDKRTVFADKLVMPRAFKVLDKGCALIGEPPHLWKMCDTDGDGKADRKEEISNTFATQGVIEHGANGLYWGMDNTIYVAEHDWNVEYKGGKFSTLPTLVRGQWGITQDDGGRIYRDVNTDPLFVDYVPSRYFMRNPALVRTRGLYEPLASQEATQIWPAHPTKGVNRGYRAEVTRPDGSASYYQGVSSPLIFRGDRLPKELYGQAVVVDSPTNIVHLLSLKDDGAGNLVAADWYKQGEFLASTDERFRPVALTQGWDGTFYIVDMYRGVSQDGPLQTDYLRDYIKQHKLWQAIHYGRIWRVVHDGQTAPRRPRMFDETPAQLVAHLSDPNGWWRDTAQQLLVLRGDRSVAPALARLATASPDPRTRVAALWTLDGLGAIDQALVLKALDDASPDMRVAGVRLAERWLGADGPVRAAVLRRMDDPSGFVRRQLTASLGELPAEARARPILAMVARYGSDPIVVDAAVSGLDGQEADALDRMLGGTPNPDAVAMLAGAVGKRRDLAQVQRLIDAGTDRQRPEAVRLALLDGLAQGLEGGPTRGAGGGGVAGGRAGGENGPRRQRPVTQFALAAKPAGVETLAAAGGAMSEPAKKILTLVSWPGKPAMASAAARTPQQEALFTGGKAIYGNFCSGCHQDQGQGAEHVGAALAGSKLVNADPSVVVRILTAGKEGKIGLMPPAGTTMSDEELASVLTYIRGSWGNAASPLAPAEVQALRKQYAARTTPWTDAELLAGQRAP